MPRLVEARYVRDYVIWLEPLKDQRYFRRFVLSPDMHTLVWPNGDDLAPEFLREHTRVPA